MTPQRSSVSASKMLWIMEGSMCTLLLTGPLKGSMLPCPPAALFISEQSIKILQKFYRLEDHTSSYLQSSLIPIHRLLVQNENAQDIQPLPRIFTIFLLLFKNRKCINVKQRSTESTSSSR